LKKNGTAVVILNSDKPPMWHCIQNFINTSGNRPKLLLVWGNKDPYFLPAGAEAYKKYLPDAILRFYGTGHFALETHAAEIGADILEFMKTLAT
jgi:pimeloyl-ACP methyl ester carboxylesterase